MASTGLPPHLEVLFTRSAIEDRLDSLADTLDVWATAAEADTGQPLLALCVLRGGVFFFSDVLLRMKQSVEPAFARASSYARSANSAPSGELQLDLGGVIATGRAVAVFDNICDSGRTFAACHAALRALGAASLRTVAMVHRLRVDSLHTPDLFGFAYNGPEWLAGYGLRDRGALMNAPEIYRIKPGAAPALTS